jgi:hypothetical protein
MKFEDIFKGKKNELSFSIKPKISKEEFSEMNNEIVEIKFSQDSYWLVNHKHRAEIEGITSIDSAELDRIVNQNCISLLVVSKKNKADIKSILLTNIINAVEVLEIGLTDIIIDDINKRYSQHRAQKKHVDWLKNELIIESNNETKIFIDNVPKGENGFRVFGKSIAIDVIINKDKKHEIKRIVNNKNSHTPNFLLNGNIQIKDISLTSTLRETVDKQLSKISSTERYIKTWEKYQEKEKEIKINEVKKNGFLTISKINRISENNYQLFFVKNENTSNWLTIETNEYISITNTQHLPDFVNEKEKSNSIKILAKHDDYIVVYSEESIENPKSSFCYASLSILGDKIVHQRRTKALNEIRDNSAPMPVLAAVLEGVDYYSKKSRKVKSLTANVKKEFGEFGPNEMQEMALDISLNSPDIVIIQGPPGTGKTKVISALATRLTEIYKDNGVAPEKNILLTAFQHDAVENMASRTEVLGLPVIKYSNKQNQSIDVIENWIIKQTEKIESTQNELEPNECELMYLDVVSNYLDYIKTLNMEKAKNDIVKIKRNNLAILPNDILDEMNIIDREEINSDDQIKTKIIENINNIRTDEISYADDGYLNLNRFLKNYARYCDDLPELKLDFIQELKNIALIQNSAQIDFSKLSDIKLELLDQLTSINIHKKILMVNSKFDSLFKKLIDFFAEYIKKNGSIYTVLTEFQNDLRSNKDRVKKTIEDYVAIVASTVQGSTNKSLSAIKPDPFDTVIIDEAARVSPLDLLIPLTRAKGRIVLVGDHRQLPHMVDEAIQKDLISDENASVNTSKYLEDSLFERFYSILKKLHEKDNVQRVVTLDTQYRMHPLIGEFISKTFYEKYGDPKIKSGTPAEKLTHSLPDYKDKVAVSINISNIKGLEKKENGSTYRAVEAEEAIRIAKSILDFDPSQSVGIITFYARQVKELFSLAEKEGLAEKDTNGEFLITKRYQKTIKAEERFRIGTVDAFQGKEFDVVILSLVRSNNIQIRVKGDIKRKFGFLTSYNRLNVAMSRAKKLIIAIGDEKMFKSEQAEEHVFGLYAFYNELINSNYGLSI